MARPATYQWDSLFSRGTFTLVQGRDFGCTVYGMFHQVRNAASHRGMTVDITESIKKHRGKAGFRVTLTVTVRAGLDKFLKRVGAGRATVIR